jgi:HEAT repeat protein
VAGHTGDAPAARALLDDPDGAVRATALGALARIGVLSTAELRAGLDDPDAAVRRRALEEAAEAHVGDAELDDAVLARLHDDDATVAEVAAFTLGERGEEGRASAAAVAALAEVATGHPDALCREAAVAALGAIGHADGLAAILAATTDKPAVRRRAVIALAPFEGPEVDEALERARTDRDWQVRQAAEDLLA